MEIDTSKAKNELVQSDTPTDEPKGDNGRTYTQEDVDRKLRGQGKKLKEYEEKILAYESAESEKKRKAMEEQGQYKELLAKAESENKALHEKLIAHTERETKRLETLALENKRRADALPEQARLLIVDGLDPDKEAIQLSKLESIFSKATIHNIDGTSGRNQTKSKEEKMASWQERVQAKMHGKAASK